MNFGLGKSIDIIAPVKFFNINFRLFCSLYVLYYDFILKTINARFHTS